MLGTATCNFPPGASNRYASRRTWVVNVLQRVPHRNQIEAAGAQVGMR